MNSNTKKAMGRTLEGRNHFGGSMKISSYTKLKERNTLLLKQKVKLSHELIRLRIKIRAHFGLLLTNEQKQEFGLI